MIKSIDWTLQMLKTRYVFAALLIGFSSVASSALQMSIGIGLPSVNIGVSVPAYPEFVIIPGYPVYYAPRMEANYFFYDGLYWVYRDDNWYESSWYNGPWWLVDPDEVPLYLLRVPVRYYVVPPAYFIGWQFDAPPRWGDHWGRDWSQRRSGWDRWNRHAIPSPAPLPTYQRNYSGDRYPQEFDHQRELNQQNYRFQPRDPVVRKQNEHSQINHQQNKDQKNSKPNVQQEKYKQERQQTNHSQGSQPIDLERNRPSRQTIPLQQDRSLDRAQQPRKTDDLSNQRSAPNDSRQRNLEYKDQYQRQEQQPPNQQNQKQNNQSNNSDRQPRHDQDRGNSRND